MRVKIKKLPHCFALPRYATIGSAGADVFAAHEDKIYLLPGGIIRIPIGIAIELPDLYAAYIVPRSGTSLNQQYMAITGTIDSDYRGEISVVLHSLRPISDSHNHVIHRGDRIAQLVISPVNICEWVPVEELGETERGKKGFGSSGT